jgi:spoIIIJ-associated protein
MAENQQPENQQGQQAPEGERARTALVEILQRMGIEGTVEMREDAEKVTLEVKGAEGGLIIGKKGATLDALQYLVQKIVHKGPDAGPPPHGLGKSIIVDTEGYRQRRIEQLEEMAHRLGEKAKQTGRIVEMDPMSPHDRRIVHMALDKVPGVTTRSEGEGSFRRLLIVPDPSKV